MGFYSTPEGTVAGAGWGPPGGRSPERFGPWRGGAGEGLAAPLSRARG